MFKAGRRNTELEQEKTCSMIYNMFVLLDINFKGRSQKRFGPQIGRV